MSGRNDILGSDSDFSMADPATAADSWFSLGNLDESRTRFNAAEVRGPARSGAGNPFAPGSGAGYSTTSSTGMFPRVALE